MVLPMPAGDAAAVKPTLLRLQSYRLEMTKPLHALVVDDVEHNRNILAEQLKAYGFFVSMAGDGREAVEKARNVVTDVIFMDYRMPNMNGIVAMQEIRKNQSNNIKIVMVSASVCEHEVEKFSQCGADLFINKPIFFPELEAQLSNLFPQEITLVELEASSTRVCASPQFSDTHKIPSGILNDIEELAEFGLVTELEEKLEGLNALHRDLSQYLLSLSTAMKLGEVAETARRIIESGK